MSESVSNLISCTKLVIVSVGLLMFASLLTRDTVPVCVSLVPAGQSTPVRRDACRRLLPCPLCTADQGSIPIPLYRWLTLTTPPVGKRSPCAVIWSSFQSKSPPILSAGRAHARKQLAVCGRDGAGLVGCGWARDTIVPVHWPQLESKRKPKCAHRPALGSSHDVVAGKHRRRYCVPESQ
jgi:hypothetical protein